jgi:hypothetical protein
MLTTLIRSCQLSRAVGYVAYPSGTWHAVHYLSTKHSRILVFFACILQDLPDTSSKLECAFGKGRIRGRRVGYAYRRTAIEKCRVSNNPAVV